MKTKNKRLNIFALQILQVCLLILIVMALAGLLRLVETILTKEQVIASEPTQSITNYTQVGYIGYGPYLPLPQNSRFVDQKTEPQVLGMTFSSSVTERPFWQAQKVDQLSPTVKITAGKSLTFWVDFKNTGTTSWRHDGAHFIALNVDGANNRQSPYRHDFWIADYRPCKMSIQQVNPDETVRFRFALTAPDQPGFYTAEFGLVAENLIWIPGGKIKLPITVLEPPPVWQAELISKSFEEIEIAPGGAFTFEAKFKNTGTATWRNNDNHFIALNVTGPPGRQSALRHDYWPADYRPCVMLTDQVEPGKTGLFRFALQVPDQAGFYFEEFNLVAENLIWIPGGYLTIPITIKNPTTPENTNPEQQDIRVGLYNTDDSTQITANKQYQITNSDGQNYGTLAGGKVTTVSFTDNKYIIEFPGPAMHTSDYPVIFSPVKVETIFEIVNFDNATAWNSQINDNRYRGQLEINHSDITNKTWLINELPLELYLRGVAESGNEDPAEYHKALIIAERTYAQYHINTGIKHADENFTVDATYDQVYRGYGFEERAHVVVAMVEATEGKMVTYDDEIVVTPYFSSTDGRTRSWEEVWSGNPKSWLVSVPDPHCEDRELHGHGVGMSAYGARAMAEEGSTYDEILEYYYTGIVIEDFY